MNLLTKKIKSQIRKHSLSEFPEECCGIIIRKDKLIDSIECENIANDKGEFFEISPRDYLKASRQGEIEAYYHSHTSDNDIFSGVDKAISESNNLPLIMYSVKKNKFSKYL